MLDFFLCGVILLLLHLFGFNLHVHSSLFTRYFQLALCLRWCFGYFLPRTSDDWAKQNIVLFFCSFF